MGEDCKIISQRVLTKENVGSNDRKIETREHVAMLNLGKAMELAKRHVRHEDVDCANEYGERGYDATQAGILFADWNDSPAWLRDGLERRGFALEWSDEWLIAYDTGKAYRSSPDSYGWKPYYVVSEDGEVVGGDEIESGNQAEWYVNEYLLNDPQRCNVFQIDLTKFGFQKWNGEFETGWHPGQNDNPREVFKRLQKEKPDHDVVFDLIGVGQFDMTWCAWIRPQD